MMNINDGKKSRKNDFVKQNGMGCSDDDTNNSLVESAEEMSGIRVRLNGVRGSVPVNGAAYDYYGGATCSVQLEHRGEILIVDAGTGLLNTEIPKGTKRVSILLTHPHVDHLLGLPAWQPAYQPDLHKAIAAMKNGNMDCRQQVAALMSGPLWPVRAEELPNTTFYTIEATSEERLGRITRFPENREDFLIVETERGRHLQLGLFQIYIMDGIHPGGCTCYRIEVQGGASVAFVLDCELDQEQLETFANFVRGCSLLICDGQYLESELEQKRGWGHSSAATAAALGRLAGVGKTVVVHHEPTRTDKEMENIQRELDAVPEYEKERCIIGREGACFEV